MRSLDPKVYKFKDSLGYIVSCCLKTTAINKKFTQVGKSVKIGSCFLML